MKIKEAYRYQGKDFYKNIIVYLGLVLLLFIEALYEIYHYKIFPPTNTEGNIAEFMSLEFSNIELIAGAVLCFVGYRSVKNNFRFLLQNGVARTNQILSQILSSLKLVFILSSISEVLLILANLWASHITTPTRQVEWFSIFEIVYENIPTNFISFHLYNFLFNFCFFLTLVAISYMVAVIYYNIHRIFRYIISISVLSYFFIFPNISITQSLPRPLEDLNNFVIITYQCSPCGFMLTLLFIATICYMISYLLLRRTSLKD